MRIATKLITGIISILVLTTGCKSNNSIKDIKQQGLMLQVRVLLSEPNDANTISYAARLIPDKGLISDNAVKTKLAYQMDSTFYIQSGKGRIYANLVQPVANGVAGTYEYLVSFDRPGGNSMKGKLIYQDKYINHQKYQITLNNE